jgi:hypothetical protein
MKIHILQRAPRFRQLWKTVLSGSVVILIPDQCRGQTLADPALSATSAQKWEAGNRMVSAEVGIVRHNYREYDSSGAAPGGVFANETGGIPVGAIEARWQGNLQFFPLWIQLKAGRAAGQTSYRGFLQQGNALTPYNNARTGNVMLDSSFRLGLPVAIYPRSQIVPFANYEWHRWQRDLAQYRETYQHQSVSAGVLVQLAPAPKWVLEADASTGHTTYVELAVPTSGFKGRLGNASIKQLGLGADYWLSGRFTVGLRWSQARYRYGASAIINRLQEPDSSTSQKILAVRAIRHY